MISQKSPPSFTIDPNLAGPQPSDQQPPAQLLSERMKKAWEKQVADEGLVPNRHKN